MEVDPRIQAEFENVQGFILWFVQLSYQFFVAIQLAELRLALEHDKEFSLSELRQKFEEEKKKEIEEVKKKQWVRSYKETLMLIYLFE